jgi:hypothetical protein
VSPVGLTANAAVAHAAAAVPNHLSAEIQDVGSPFRLFDRPGVCRRWDRARRPARGRGARRRSAHRHARARRPGVASGGRPTCQAGPRRPAAFGLAAVPW